MAVEVEYLNANSINNINTNFQRTKEALIETLGRDGDVPNHMNSDLDMNSNDILNVGLIDAQDFTIDGVPINGALELAVESALAAEASAQNAAQSEADAQTAADEAEAALAEIEGIISGFERTDFATKALAEASSLEVAPLYIRIQSYANIGDNGGGLYRKAVSEPTHPGKLSITLQDTTVVWYELVEQILRPEQFGSIGINTAGDTAAWVALASVASGRSKAMVVADGSYLIAGSAVVIDGPASISLDLTGSTLHQQTNLSRTITLRNAQIVTVRGGTFVGRGGSSGEFNPASGSYNGVAGIRVDNSQVVRIENVVLRDHAGGHIYGENCDDVEVSGCVIEGIGPSFISVGDNGSDFGISFTRNDLNSVTDWMGHYRYHGNRIFNTAFGIASAVVKALIVTENEIGPCPGQHGVYSIDTCSAIITGNVFKDLGELGIKQQMERRLPQSTGFNPWATGTTYAKGAEIKMYSTIWVALVTHVAAGSFDAQIANWGVSRKNHLWNLKIHDNIFDGAMDAIQMPKTAQVAGYNIYHYGVSIQDNTIRNCSADGMVLFRLQRDAKVCNNTITNVTGFAGIYGNDCAGEISDNRIEDIDGPAIYISAHEHLDIYDNKILNACRTDEIYTVPVVVFNLDGTAPPESVPARVVTFDQNSIMRLIDGGDYAQFIADFHSQYSVTVTNLRTLVGSRGAIAGYSSRPFRVQGSFIGRATANPESAGIV